ncbi:MAG TPA: EamA family transporter, partial [Candidatus Nitrosocosmicus sp.]|nr:EamA family transporter [Candidatus Nitrosocosmicus sp.]
AQLFTLTHQHIVNLIVIVFSTGLVALAIYYFGLKKSSARVTTICELTWPASAILIDYFYFHKSLSLTQMLGIALLLFSIHKITTYKNNV